VLSRPGNAPNGVPHCLTKDDEFEGYRLPAGTVLTWTNWNISNSPEEYEQPARFWPERFINEDLEKPFKGHLTFGVGMCFLYVPSRIVLTNLYRAQSLCWLFGGYQQSIDRPSPNCVLL